MPIGAGIYFSSFDGKRDEINIPLVLIHGAGGDHLSWPVEIRRLPGRRVYALDLPGHARSEGSGLRSIEAYASSVLSWMDASDLERVVIIGHSMGSAIAIRLAVAWPERVGGLVLAGTGARLQVAPRLLQGTAGQETFHGVVETIVRWSYAPQASAKLTKLAARRLAEIHPGVLHGDFLACDAFDGSDRLQDIIQPTLVICGLEDRMTPPALAQFMVDRLPNARLKLVASAGHMVMLEQPGAVAEAVLDFFKESAI